MEARIVKHGKEKLNHIIQPKYLRHNLWHEHSFTQTTADWSEYASPLPRPPKSELDNPITTITIRNNLPLFQIITPININKFHSLLQTHPNHIFVESVCQGLHKGFWPWADTLKDNYPAKHDASLPASHDEQGLNFLRSQINTEVQKNRFSSQTPPRDV